MPSTAYHVEAGVVRVSPLLPDPDRIRCDGVEIDDKLVTLRVRGCAVRGRCPACDHSLRRVHSWYERRLTDLPWHGRSVNIHWRRRKFFCRNPTCTQRIFTERLPQVAASGFSLACRLGMATTVTAQENEKAKRLLCVIVGVH